MYKTECHHTLYYPLFNTTKYNTTTTAAAAAATATATAATTTTTTTKRVLKNTTGRNCLKNYSHPFHVPCWFYYSIKYLSYELCVMTS